MNVRLKHFCVAAGLAAFCVPAFTATAQQSSAAPLFAETSFDANSLSLQEPTPPATRSVDDGWRVDLTLWAWLVGVDGKVGARGQSADVGASFLDIIDATDSAFAIDGRIEVGKGRWGAFVDARYLTLGVDNQSGPAGNGSVDVTYDEIIVDFGLMYRIGEWEPTGQAAQNRQNTSLDLYAGGRYTRVELELDPANFSRVSRDKDWLDPIVGARLTLPLSRHWHTSINGDIGGFGVSSDITYSATAMFGYDFRLFKTDATVFLGYRAIGWDYSDGSGSNEFIFDVVEHGPILGFALSL